jgi:hypothetical protein
MFCVKDGKETGEVASIQASNNLNSNHCFLFSNNSQVYIWKGKYSNDVKSSQNVAIVLNPGAKTTIVEENSENETFWREIGGKKSIFTIQMKTYAKCFFFSNATGMVNFGC